MELILIVSFVSYVVAFDKASFYGASYISYPLQEAKGTTDITFRFRTRLSDALLLLAAGKTDYCMVRLEKGRVKLNINLGAGETEVSSPASSAGLGDWQWHRVAIVRREADLTMKVDDTTVDKKLPGRFFELNIHYGLFLGGQGHFSELFLGHMENFRGCMEDVNYNGVKIIESGRSRGGAGGGGGGAGGGGGVRVEGVTWNCAAEFEATVRDEISFVEEGAYLVLPGINSRAGGRWRMELKTAASDAVVLYNAGGGGGGARGDFLAVEVVGGEVRVRTARAQLRHPARLDDGRWHDLRLAFNPELIEVSVDEVGVSARVEGGAGGRHLDLADAFYVGGIEGDKRARARARGLHAPHLALSGCVKPIEVGDEVYGLPNATVTSGVRPHCVWRYPCLEGAGGGPCVRDAVCRQHGLDRFTCTCDLDLCIDPAYAEKYKVYSKWSALELVAVSPLVVAEGGVAEITRRHVDVTLDAHKYGVRPAGVTFAVERAPRHGRLALDLPAPAPGAPAAPAPAPGGARQTFTLLDLSADKVRYVHDGSEQHQDAIVLEMELAQETRFTLPSYLQGRHAFALHVNVTPVDDPPALLRPRPPHDLLALTQGARKTITSEVFKAEDPDTPPDRLTYTVLASRSQRPYSGHFEKGGRPVETFTQRDVDDGLVSFVHDADGRFEDVSFEVALQVSDGGATGASGVLRVAVSPLRVRLVNDTGVRVAPGGAALITAANLTFAATAEGEAEADGPPVRYDVVEPPRYGVLEELRLPDRTWRAVDSFSAEAVREGRVRYLHLLGAPAHDRFRFRATAEGARPAPPRAFRVTFVRLELYEAARADLVVETGREATLTAHHLQYATRPLPSAPDHVRYLLVRPPRYGALLLAGRRLEAGARFTQLDVDRERLRYRLHRRAYSPVHDEVVASVAAGACDPLVATLTVRHAPPGGGGGGGARRRLRVEEGGRAAIPLAALDLPAAAARLSELAFEVTRAPRHGRLEVVGAEGSPRRDAATSFTLAELVAGRVLYAHDDSESRRDSFRYLALSPEPEDFQYVGEVEAEVALRDDNGPVRVGPPDVALEVVPGGTRLVTSRHLAYADADLDSRPADLVYTLRRSPKEPPNGALFRTDAPTEEIDRFTQEDVDRNLIAFRHRGPERGRLAFRVSDGTFETSGHLEVRAGPPYVRARVGAAAVVRAGGAAPLRALALDTNMNCLEEDVHYEVTLPPRHGALALDGAPLAPAPAPLRFTQRDVMAGRLVYRAAPAVGADQFGFRVSCSDAWSEGVYPVRVYPPAYWEPLRVLAHGTLLVEEFTAVDLTRDVLEVMHPEIDPSDVVYHVTEPPRHGWLEVREGAGGEGAGGKGAAGEGARALAFTQAAVNARRVLYVQSGANRTRDRFAVNATNGITGLAEVVVHVVVVPERYYVAAEEVAVEEGGRAPLAPSTFRTLTEYYVGKVVAYRVLERPRFGTIVGAGERPLDLLPVLELAAGHVQYVHSGAEEAEDTFAMCGETAEGKRSAKFEVRVRVAPLDDEPPIVAANTGLCVPRGGAFTLTRNELYVTDADTAPENVTVTVEDISSGYMALVGDRGRAVRAFTQADVDAGRVLFVHTGGTKGKMTFDVSDGVHTLAGITFLISTKPVALKLVRNERLVAFPRSRTPLTADALAVRCSDGGREVAYRVRRPPALGRLLLLAGDVATPTDAFKQRDLDEARVLYEHERPPPSPALRYDDSFEFDAEAALAPPLEGLTFAIEVSVSAGGLARLVVAPPVTVEEGGEVALRVDAAAVGAYLEREAGVLAPRLEATAGGARHGVLLGLEGGEGAIDAAALAAGRLRYRHDHSDTTADEVRVALRLLPDRVPLCDVAVPIAVTPVNDEPFRLVTEAPLIRVVLGENYTVTRDDLLAEDADTPPADIAYDVVGGPTRGRLLVLGPEPRPATRFTQADVDAGRVLFEQAGGPQPATFYLRVSDGRFEPTYAVFTVEAVPVTLSARSSRPLVLQQGSNAAALSAEQVDVETNAARDRVEYEVSRPPARGLLYVGRDPVRAFSHRDLVARRVLYVQNDMTAAEDTFELRARLLHANATPPFAVAMQVRPLVAVGTLRVEAGARRARLTLAHLDAGALAALAGGDPVYEVTRAPRLGRLLEVVRASGGNGTAAARETPVARFTHERLAAGLLHYELARPVADRGGAEDGFRFVVSAALFQPAVGDLRILIGERRDRTSSEPEGREAGPGAGPGRGPAPGPGAGWAAYAGGAVGAAGVVVAALAAVRCRRRRRARDKLPPPTPAPIPLPRPPDHLMPSPPRRATPPEDGATGASTPLASAGSGVGVACKVTPLADAALADLTARYPYGVDDHTDAEDWSSYEASECAYGARAGAGSGAGAAGAGAANPMLRRNQYWV